MRHGPKFILAIGTVAAALFAISLAGCSEPAFQGGIRDQSLESLSGVVPGIALPGVLDYGDAANGGSNNGATKFEGVTSGTYAIDDHTNAAVGTSWTITFNFSNVMPACPPTTHTWNVPNAGATIRGICFAE